jgi:hypothetical protein
MKYISSQRYLDPEIVEAKKVELADVSSVSIPCSYVGTINGTEYAMIADKHHTLAAARELGLEISFKVNTDPEQLEGDALLEARYIDSSYYDIETGIDEF